jgi:type I restriction enzyme R subunit
VSAHGYNEDVLVEQPAIELFGSLKWESANCFHEFEQAGGSPLGRETPAEVVLVSRLRTALEKLNRDLTAEAVTKTIEELTRDRSVMSPTAANREVYRLIKDGVKVSAGGKAEIGKRQEEETVTVRVIDWENPGNNDFFLASQFWVSGEMYKRRADLVGFVNGLPLVFIELKASHKRLEDAYNKNLRDYKDTSPSSKR